jgi:hypothetical protein
MRRTPPPLLKASAAAAVVAATGLKREPPRRQRGNGSAERPTNALCVGAVQAAAAAAKEALLPLGGPSRLAPSSSTAANAMIIGAADSLGARRRQEGEGEAPLDAPRRRQRRRRSRAPSSEAAAAAQAKGAQAPEARGGAISPPGTADALVWARSGNLSRRQRTRGPCLALLISASSRRCRGLAVVVLLLMTIRRGGERVFRLAVMTSVAVVGGGRANTASHKIAIRRAAATISGSKRANSEVTPKATTPPSFRVAALGPSPPAAARFPPLEERAHQGTEGTRPGRTDEEGRRNRVGKRPRAPPAPPPPRRRIACLPVLFLRLASRSRGKSKTKKAGALR